MTVPDLPGLRPAGPQLPPGFQPLAALPLIVLVGVTGVGKSSALAALRGLGLPFRLLPDRREITDAVMIAPFCEGPVTDRAARFALTARYREAHPGGMAQALGTLALEAGDPSALVAFDGLRGLDEVQYAAGRFPTWRFVALGAPDAVRLRRLLGRADAFDQATGQASGDLLADLGCIEGVSQVFTPAELERIAALAEQGFAPAEVLAKAKIVVTERRHYDPEAAAGFLATLPAHRVLELDTLRLGPAEVAARIGEWV